MSSTVTIPASSVEKLRRLRENREEQDRVAQKLNKFHQRLRDTPMEKAEKYSDKLWQKMREYYVEAKGLAEEEQRLCGQLLGELGALQGSKGAWSAAVPGNKKKGQMGQGGTHTENIRKTKPKPTAGSKDSSLSKASTAKGQQHSATVAKATETTVAGSPATGPATGAAGSGQVQAGQVVAARVSPEGAEKDEWIVVRVLGYDQSAQLMRVVDEEPGEEGEPGPRTYELDSSCIIAFPSIEDPSAAPEYPPGTCVLAVYPGTTSLYKATVSVSAPARQGSGDDYFLEFDDDEEEGVEGLPQRRVQFHHVVALPQGHRQ